MTEDEWEQGQHRKRLRRWGIAWDVATYIWLAGLVYVYWWLLW